MTFDIEKMLREGASAQDIAKKVAEATATAQRKIDTEKAAKAAAVAKANEEAAVKKEKATAAAKALNDFLRTCKVCGPEEEVFSAQDLLDAVNVSIDDVLDDFLSLFSNNRKSIFDKYLN